MSAAEECDDGNAIPDDGCEPDCVFSCHSNAECDDLDACNGAETCVTSGTGATELMNCLSGEPPAVERCEICTAELGPHLPDEDGDGFPADRGQPCDDSELDCDDLDATVNPAASEICNGLDDDCDELVDEGVTVVTCAQDLDGDGYPGDATAMSMGSCTSCPAGTVPLRTDAIGNALLDCWDVADAFGPLVNPGQTAFFTEPYCASGDPGCALPFDYDCDGLEEQQDTGIGPNCDLLTLRGCRGDGWLPPVPDCGVTATFVDCRPLLGLVCRGQREDRRQACR